MKRKLNHIKYKAFDGLQHCKAYVFIETMIYRKELLINPKSKIYIKDSQQQNCLDEIKDWMIFNNPSNYNDFYRIINDDKILINRLRKYLICSEKSFYLFKIDNYLPSKKMKQLNYELTRDLHDNDLEVEKDECINKLNIVKGNVTSIVELQNKISTK